MQRIFSTSWRTLAASSMKPQLKQSRHLNDFLKNRVRSSGESAFNIEIKRYIAITSYTLSQNKDKTSKPAAKDGQAKDKKVKSNSPKITLIAQNQALSITSLEDAQKLAKRRDLHLVLVQKMDTKTQRPVYKLVTAAEMLSDELKDLKKDDKSGGAAAHKKTEKSLTIGARIEEHDLMSRVKNIGKWLTKQHDVRILIQGGSDDASKAGLILNTIEQNLKEPTLIGKIQQKRFSGSNIKFIIVPVVNEEPSSEQMPKEPVHANKTAPNAKEIEKETPQSNSTKPSVVNKTQAKA